MSDSTPETVTIPETVVPEQVVVVPEQVIVPEPVVVVPEQVVVPEPVVVVSDEPVVVLSDEPVVPETVKPDDEPVVSEPVVSEPVVVHEPVVSKPKKEMNLSEILVDFLRADSNKIEITPKLKQMIAMLPLMKSNDDTISHLENMEYLFNKIIEDKQINVLDMGEIIELLKEMYIVYDTMRLTVTADEVGKVFKVLVQVFIQYKLGNQLSDDEKMVIIGSIYKILTLCTQMIDLKDTTKKLKKKISCFACF